MDNIDKVLKGLSIHSDIGEGCYGCPYFDKDDPWKECSHNLCADALKALEMRDCKECQKIFNGFSKEDTSMHHVPTDRKAYKRPTDVEHEVEKFLDAKDNNGVPWVCPTCGIVLGFNYGQTLMHFQCGRCGAFWKCMNFDEVSSMEVDSK